MTNLGRILVTLGTFATALVQWLFVWLFTQRFAQSDVDSYILLYSIATPAFVAAQLGLRDVYLTLRARYGHRSYLVLRLAGSLVGVVVVVGIGLALRLPPDLTAAMAVMKLGESAIDLRCAFVQSQHQMVRLGTLMVTYAVAMLAILVSATLASGNPAAPVAITGVFGMLLALADAVRPLAAESERTGGYRDILRAALPVTAAQLIFALVASTPVFVLEAAGGRASVGIYGAAAYLLTFANLVGASLQTLLVPGFRDLVARADRRGLILGARRAGVGLGVVAVLGAAVAIAFGPQVLSLVYGPSYAMGRLHLVPLVLAAAIVPPLYVFNALLLVLNAYRSGAVASALTLAGSLAAGGVTVALGGDPILAASVTALGGSLVRMVASAVIVGLRLRAPDPTPHEGTLP